MSKKQITGMAVMLIISMVFVIFWAGRKPKEQRLEIYDVFDTYCEITLVSAKDKDGAMLECNEYLHKLHNMWTIENPDSEIEKLNASSGKAPVSLSEETIDVLYKSIEGSKETSGFFDITVGTISKLWDIGSENPRIPQLEEITDAIHKTGFQNLKLDRENNTAQLTKEGASVNLGAIAKGYATEGILKILKKEKIDSALINLGGNAFAKGTQADGSPWRIGIQDPEDSSKTIGILTAYDRAVITSGNYQRYFEKDGVKYHHIFNPFTGMPANSGLLSVTIINPDPVMADILSTACFVIGYNESIALLKETESQAVFVTENNTVYYSKDLEEGFEHDNRKYEYKAF